MILSAQRVGAMAVGLAMWCAVPAMVATQAANDVADTARLIDVLHCIPAPSSQTSARDPDC